MFMQGIPTPLKSLAGDVTQTLIKVTKSEQHQSFTKLLFEIHNRSRLSITLASHLAGIAPSYLAELLAGQKHLIRLHRLRSLCENAWQLSHSHSLAIFTARVCVDPRLRMALPIELYWRMAAFTRLSNLADHVGVERSTISRFFSGKQIPTFDITLRICRSLSFNIRSAHHIHLALVKSIIVGDENSLINDSADFMSYV